MPPGGIPNRAGAPTTNLHGSIHENPTFTFPTFLNRGRNVPKSITASVRCSVENIMTTSRTSQLLEDTLKSASSRIRQSQFTMALTSQTKESLSRVSVIFRRCGDEMVDRSFENSCTFEEKLRRGRGMLISVSSVHAARPAKGAQCASESSIVQGQAVTIQQHPKPKEE